MSRWVLLCLGPMLALAGCNREQSTPVPPRLVGEVDVPVSTSRVVVPVTARLSDLERELNAEVPQTLLTIDRQEKACVPAARLTICLKHERPCEGKACEKVPCKVGFQKAKITPTLGCRIVGAVTRGPIRLSGNGDVIHLSMPVSAEISAKDVGKMLSETATAQAETRATIRLGMGPDWQPTAKVDINYDWTEKPGIELLGQRITFAQRADPELAKVIAKLEASIPRHIARLQPRAHLEKAWAKGFTSLELNRRNPPVWMRITPKQLAYGGYSVQGGELILNLELEAAAETFVGDRPADLPATPLPPPGRLETMQGFRVQAPVIADYAQLEPILAKALGKLAAKPIEVPAIGAVRASFGKPTIYATTGGKVAIGLPIAASTAAGALDTKGTVWLTGVPYNLPNSPKVLVRDLGIAAETDRTVANLLVAIAEAPAVVQAVEAVLSQDFSGDIAKLKVKVDRALTDKRVGDFVLDASIDSWAYGVVQPLAQGAFLPVEVTGSGTLRFDPLSPEAKAAWEKERAARRAEQDRKAAAAAAAIPGPGTPPPPG